MHRNPLLRESLCQFAQLLCAGFAHDRILKIDHIIHTLAKNTGRAVSAQHNGISVHEIEELTKASTATISRINKCLVYGAEGYQRVLERLENQEK